jgi:endonuclease/exonuclease/phosphatase family metal-dependent hydrolase
MQVEVSTSVGFDDPSLLAEVILQDERYEDTFLGSITFPEFLEHVPVGITVSAYPEASNVDTAIRDRFDYARSIEAQARSEADVIIDDFRDRLLIGLGSGILVGLAGNEAAAAAYRARRRYPDSGAGGARHPALSGAGCGVLAVSLLASAAIPAAMSIRPNTSHYESAGLIGMALESNGRFSELDLHNDVLNSIFEDFQATHACPETPYRTIHSAERPDLSVTTYNIKKGEYGIDAVAAELRATGSDIILLQEVTPEALQALSKQLGMESVSGWTIENDVLTFGNAILTSLPVLASQTYPLPSEGVEPRGLLAATLALPDGSAVVAATFHLTNQATDIHGDQNQTIREDQADEIHELLQELGTEDVGVIAAGDMNEGIGSDTYRSLTRDLEDTLNEDDALYAASSFPSNGHRMDVILESTDWQITDTFRGGSTASDHCLEGVRFMTPGSPEYSDASAPTDAGGITGLPAQN